MFLHSMAMGDWQAKPARSLAFETPTFIGLINELLLKMLQEKIYVIITLLGIANILF